MRRQEALKGIKNASNNGRIQKQFFFRMQDNNMKRRKQEKYSVSKICYKPYKKW